MDCFLGPVKWYQNGLVKYHVLSIIILVLHLNRLKIILRVKPEGTESLEDEKHINKTK